MPGDGSPFLLFEGTYPGTGFLGLWLRVYHIGKRGNDIYLLFWQTGMIGTIHNDHI
jgi:hypothetical protein